MKLKDLCPIISKECGFYITDLKNKIEIFFKDSDDFYETPLSQHLMDRECVWIEAKNNHLNIIVK